MDTLTMLGIAGFLMATLLLGIWLGALDGPVTIERGEFYVAKRAFDKSVDKLSPISELAKFMAEDNGKAR